MSATATRPDGGAYTERTPRVVAAGRLTRRAGREKSGRFLVEGAQAVREALAWARAGRGRVHEMFTVRADDELADAAATEGIAVSLVTERAAAALSETVTPQGIVAVCDLLDSSLDSVFGAVAGDHSAVGQAGVPPLLAVGVATSDPGNAGTLVRVSDAVGADAVVFTEGSVDPHNGKCVRASTGSLFHLPVVRSVPAEMLVDRCRQAGLRVLAADAGGEIELDGADLAGPLAVLFGSEAHGLDREVLAAADGSIRVPIYGAAESLNLGTAAAVCLYACARARRGC